MFVKDYSLNVHNAHFKLWVASLNLDEEHKIINITIYLQLFPAKILVFLESIANWNFNVHRYQNKFVFLETVWSFS